MQKLKATGWVAVWPTPWQAFGNNGSEEDVTGQFGAGLDGLGPGQKIIPK